MTKTKLSAARLDRVHAVMAQHVERGHVAGVVTLLSRGSEVHVDAVGAMEVGGKPMRRDTIFRIVSMTKPIVAAATMILVEENVLGLDESVERLLPELADRQVLERIDAPLDRTVPAKRAITVRDLLTMRMGFGMIMEPSGDFPIQQALNKHQLLTGAPRPSTPHGPAEWMRRLGTLPLMHQPGERWMYHIAFDVLGVLVARAAQQPLEDFLRERIFEPLGMRDTGFSVPPAKLHRLASVYRFRPETESLELDDAADDSLWSRPPVFPSGSGGLVSTVDDYLAFGRMMLDGGVYQGERLLSTRSIEAMTSNQISAEQRADSAFFPGFWDSRGWGLGVSVVTAPDDVSPTPGRFGWDGGYGTSWCSDPHEELVGILMIQRMYGPSGPQIDQEFWRAAYGRLDD